MSKVSVGFAVMRRIVDAHAVRGKTFSAYGHELFPTREGAQAALDRWTERKVCDRRFTYDVREVFMEIEDADDA